MALTRPFQAHLLFFSSDDLISKCELEEELWWQVLLLCCNQAPGFPRWPYQRNNVNSPLLALPLRHCNQLQLAEVTAVFTWLRGCWEGLLLQRCAGSAEKLICSQGVCVWGRVGALKTRLEFLSITLGFIFPSG